MHFDAQARERFGGAFGKIFRVGEQQPVGCLEEENAGCRWIDGAEIPAQRVVRKLTDGACELDPGGSTADDRECQPRRIAFTLRLLEGFQELGTDGGRVFDNLEPGCALGPRVMAEVVVRRARRQDQVVIRNAIVVEDDFLGVDVDVPDFGLQHADVLLSLEDRTQRRGDVRGGETAGGDLVEKRLE